MFFSGERTCLITGANSGIGRAAAVGLARLGVSLLLVARNRVRGERLVHDLKTITGNEKVKLFIADLSSLQSVSNLADEIKSGYNSIDILINNAGAFFERHHLTEDGLEATFAVNYLSRFLLTNLLCELIKNSSQGRIINVSGESHRKGRINYDDLCFSRSYKASEATACSKIADIMFVYHLAEMLKGTRVTANCMHPGAVASNIINNSPDAGMLTRFMYKLISPFLRTPEKGAETILYLATSPKVSNVTGKYFLDRKAVQSSPSTYNKLLREKLWQESLKLTGKYLITEKQN